LENNAQWQRPGKKCVSTIFFLFQAATQLALQVHQERTQVVCQEKSDFAIALQI